MAAQYRQANYSYLIQVTSPKGEHVEFMRIDQEMKSPNFTAEVNRIGNQVHAHLHGLHRRTGCSYLVIAEGMPSQVNRIQRAADPRGV